jgi:hypothetical protein
MDRKQLKELIRHQMEVRLFKEANNIPDDESEDDKDKDPNLKNTDDIGAGPTDKPIPGSEPPAKPGEKNHLLPGQVKLHHQKFPRLNLNRKRNLLVPPVNFPAKGQ